MGRKMLRGLVRARRFLKGASQAARMPAILYRKFRNYRKGHPDEREAALMNFRILAQNEKSIPHFEDYAYGREVLYLVRQHNRLMRQFERNQALCAVMRYNQGKHAKDAIIVPYNAKEFKKIGALAKKQQKQAIKLREQAITLLVKGTRIILTNAED